MESVESHRKTCLKRQTELRSLLMGGNQHNKAIQLFLYQHALLHSKDMARTETWSFEDEILNDMPEEQVRRLPTKGGHPIAWLIWHIARCEDITMNLLVTGTSQILNRNEWIDWINTPVSDTGNAMDAATLKRFSEMINIEALRAYRSAVGCRTREIAQQLKPADLKQKIEPQRLIRVMDEGAVVEEAQAIADYWSRRTVAGLLLMPATRHNLIHLSEALRLKRKYNNGMGG